MKHITHIFQLEGGGFYSGYGGIAVVLSRCWCDGGDDGAATIAADDDDDPVSFDCLRDFSR